MYVNKVTIRNILYFLFIFFFYCAESFKIDSNSLLYFSLFYLSLFSIICQIIFVKYTEYEILLMLFTFMITFYSIIIGEKKVLFILLGLFMSKDIKIRAILKMYFLCGITMFFAHIVLYKIGIIQDININFIRKFNDFTVYERHSLGFKNPNHAGYFFFILITLFFILIKQVRIIYFILAFLLNQFMYTTIYSLTSYLIVNLFLFMTFCVKYMHVYKYLIFKILTCSVACFCFIISYIISYFYSYHYEVLEKLNLILSGRIELSNLFLDKYKVNLFGQRLLYNSDETDFINYAVLDNSYIKILLQFGLIPTILFLLCNFFLIKLMLQKKLYIESISICCMSIYCMSESFIFNFHINYTLIFLSFILFKDKINEYAYKR